MTEIGVAGHERVECARFLQSAEQVTVFHAAPSHVGGGLDLVMRGQRAGEVVRQTLVDEETHLGGGSDEQPAGALHEGDGFFPAHGGELREKFVQGVSAFDVFQKCLHGHAGAGEARCAAHEFGVHGHDFIHVHAANDAGFPCCGNSR